MKAISLWQPWASLWCSGAKAHETRQFRTTFRGWVAVHAAKRLVEVHPDLLAIAIREGLTDGIEAAPYYYGCIVGAVELVDCLPTKIATPVDETDRICGDWSLGRYAWKRDRFVALDDPIPWRGQQGWFEVPDSLFAGCYLP